MRNRERTGERERREEKVEREEGNLVFWGKTSLVKRNDKFPEWESFRKAPDNGKHLQFGP